MGLHACMLKNVAFRLLPRGNGPSHHRTEILLYFDCVFMLGVRGNYRVPQHPTPCSQSMQVRLELTLVCLPVMSVCLSVSNCL